MGAWDSGPFDNDDAADVLGEVADAATPADGLVQLRGALNLGGDEYLESPDVSCAVAAAAAIGWVLDDGVPGPVQRDDRWRGVIAPGVDQATRFQAIAALTRAFDPRDNEWLDLRQESDLVDDVSAALTPYRAALSQS